MGLPVHEEPAMDELWNTIERITDRMGIQEWTLALAGVIVVGLICLRGFGSRSNY